MFHIDIEVAGIPGKMISPPQPCWKITPPFLNTFNKKFIAIFGVRVKISNSKILEWLMYQI